MNSFYGKNVENYSRKIKEDHIDFVRPREHVIMALTDRGGHIIITTSANRDYILLSATLPG